MPEVSFSKFKNEICKLKTCKIKKVIQILILVKNLKDCKKFSFKERWKTYKNAIENLFDNQNFEKYKNVIFVKDKKVYNLLNIELPNCNDKNDDEEKQLIEALSDFQNHYMTFYYSINATIINHERLLKACNARVYKDVETLKTISENIKDFKEKKEELKSLLLSEPKGVCNLFCVLTQDDKSLERNVVYSEQLIAIGVEPDKCKPELVATFCQCMINMREAINQNDAMEIINENSSKILNECINKKDIGNNFILSYVSKVNQILHKFCNWYKKLPKPFM